MQLVLAIYVEKILEIYFKTETGKKTLTTAKPNQSLDLAAVTEAQKAIIEANVSNTSTGDLNEALGGSYIVKDVEPLA